MFAINERSIYMGKKFDEVKDNHYRCEFFEHEDMDHIMESINNFLSAPLKNEELFRIVPIDISLATKVVPYTSGVFGGKEAQHTIDSKVTHSVLMVYEKVSYEQ